MEFSSNSTRKRTEYLSNSSTSTSNNIQNNHLNKPSRPEKSTRRIIVTDRRNNNNNKLTTSSLNSISNSNYNINGNNGKDRESDEEILRREVEMEWNSTRRDRGIEDSRTLFHQNQNNNNQNNSGNNSASTSKTSSPKLSRKLNNSSSKNSITQSSSGNSISRGKRRKMTIEREEEEEVNKILIKPRPNSISSINSNNSISSEDGNSIYEDANDYFEEIKEEFRAEYELGGTRPLFSLLPSPFPNSISSRRPSNSSIRSPLKNIDLTNSNNYRKSSNSNSNSSTSSSPILRKSDLPPPPPLTISTKENSIRRSWTPKPLVLTPARTVAIPLTSTRPTSAQGFNGHSSTGSNYGNGGPLSPIFMERRASTSNNSPISRPGSAMSYVINSPTSENGTGTRRRQSLGYIDSSLNPVLNTSSGRNGNGNSTSSTNNNNNIGKSNRNRDSNSSSNGYYGTDLKRNGGSDHSEDRESPDSSYDIWEESDRRESLSNSTELLGLGTTGGIANKISDILEVVEEISGLWQEEQEIDDEEQEIDDEEEEDREPPLTPVIHLSLPSPIQHKTLPVTASSSYSHSLATLDETTIIHLSDPPSSIALEPPTPPPPFPLPVLPNKKISQPLVQDDRFFSTYTDFLKTRSTGTRSVQSNEVYDAYWDANSAAARLNRADSSNYGSEDGSVGSRIRNGFVPGETFLNTASAIARRNTLNKGFPPPSPPSSHSDNDSLSSSQYGNALEEQNVLRMELELLDGLTPKVTRIKNSIVVGNQFIDKPLPNPTFIPQNSNSTNLNSDYSSPPPPLVIRRQSPTMNEFGAVVTKSTNNLKDPTSNFWPPLDDGKTKVISLSPRLEALALEGPSSKIKITSSSSNNNDTHNQKLRHQSSLASSTGSRRWSSAPFSSILPNGNNKTKRDSKLSKSTNSKIMLCMPIGAKNVGKNGESDRRGLDVFGISEDEDEEEEVEERNDEVDSIIRNGSIITTSSNGSMVRIGKKFSVGATSKRLFSFNSKKSKSSLRSGSPSPSIGSSPIRPTAGLGITHNPINEWNGRTTVIASSPPVIPTLIALSSVDRKNDTWTSSLTLPPPTIASKRFSTSSSYSERRPVPSYYLPEVLNSHSSSVAGESNLPTPTPSSPSSIQLRTNPSYLNRSSPSIPSPTSLAVATVLVQGPPSPRIPPPHFQLPDHAPILPHIRQDSDPFNPDLKMSHLSSSNSINSSPSTSNSSTSTPTTPATTIFFPSTSTPPIVQGNKVEVKPLILLQHTFPARRGSDHSPHGKSVVLPVRKVKVLEVNPRVTFRSQREF